MKILLSALKSFIDIHLSENDLAHQLTMAGFEVESIEHFSCDFEKVVVGKILEIHSHPNADRLTLCKVSTGKETFSIVCGAKNIQPSDVVPVALDGAKLPGEKVIKASKIRGEFSQGMLCSKVELGLGEGESGIWILPQDLPLGEDIKEVLKLKDTAFILNVTPNRPDALSIKGMAREIAALTELPLKNPQGKCVEENVSIEKMIDVTIENFQGCPHYMARFIQNVQVGPSPFWLKQRLERMGQRSINNIVDITNWILLEWGHPLHAFDFDLLKGGGIVVRNAQHGEKMIAIDGRELVLEPSMLVIADGKGPVALAGIMGGKETGVTEKTKNILLECAYFSPSVIRRTSKALGMSSESSYRFERGVDPLGLPEALDQAAMLIAEISGGEVAKGIKDISQKRWTPQIVHFNPEHCEKLLGINVPENSIQSIFSRLQLKVIGKNPKSWEIEIPSFRYDLTKEVDLIEEVARLWGYQHIPENSPRIGFSLESSPLPKAYQTRSKAKRVLQGLGLNEAITYSFSSLEILEKTFQKKEAIPLMNPLRQDNGYLRTSLIPGLITVLSFNEHRGMSHIQYFEIGKCFLPPPKKEVEDFERSREIETLGIAMMGKKEEGRWGNKEVREARCDFFDLKGLIEEFFDAIGLSNVSFQKAQAPGFHPGRSTEVFVNQESLGFLGEVHPDLTGNFDLREKVFLAEFNFEILLENLNLGKKFQELPRYPSIHRDMALLIEKERMHEEIVKVIWEKADQILKEVRLFDVYQGPQVPAHQKSLAYTLTFRSDAGTLKDEEVDAVERQIKEKLVQQFQCQFR
ncbi:MAG: phenylalanine--tRNA ligase subunit beta [Chlamydiae bacterium]|nr:phenylalanine--tRNA ligase subunit beta [Chlamydiota bacterium]MBI3276142.1 phenylalanine--tRNA ligase subunit beta [Chlamydiota bacterium]